MTIGVREPELNRIQRHDVAPEPKTAILGAGMSQHLEKYVGRTVRLNQSAFRQLSRKSRQRGVNPPDNYFVVADFRRQMRQLICYGANLRIVVDVADVVLV